MKKRTKIILLIVSCIIVVGALFLYKTYKSVFGSEEIIGKTESVPDAVKDLPPVTKDSADWLNWRGSNFDGKTHSMKINKNFIKNPKKLWQVDYLCIGSGTSTWSSPVVQGNRLIVMGRDEKRDLVFCLNSINGELLWNGAYNANCDDGHGSGPRATPCIYENKVYTFGRSGDLVCWQLDDGKIIWKKSVTEEGGEAPSWGCSSSPVIIDNKVIVQGGGNALIIAYDKNDGSVIWKSLQGNAGYATIIPAVIDSELRILAYHGQGLSCMDIKTGKVYYSIPWPTAHGVNATTPIFENGVVFHTAAYDMGCQALKLFKDKFELLWKNNTIESHHSDPILIDGFLYGYSGNSTQNRGKFKCVELATGKEMWSTKDIGWGTVAFTDGLLICMDIKGNLHLVNPKPDSFDKIGSFNKILDNVSNHAWTVPVVANGKLYLRHMQTLVCIDLK